MESYIYIIIIVLLVILITITLFTNLKSKETKTDSNKIINELKEEHNNFKLEVLKLINESTTTSNTEMFKNVSLKFDSIDKRINETIDKNLKKTDKTFIGVIERLSKIDEQHKNINKLSKEVLSLNNILTDKQTRGLFGEVQLYKILESVFGDNSNLYERQKSLSNNKRPDAIIHAPKPLGSIAVDSKFPLENYKNLIDPNITKEELNKYSKIFINDIKTHINAIKDKYIIKNETADQAIMFIPAESIYLDIVSKHYDLINYAYENKIWITSPTTLISMLTVIESVNTTVKQNEQANVLIEELKHLSIEFKRYKERAEKLFNKLNSLDKDIKNLNITQNKIYNRFKDIESGKLD